MPAWGKVGPGRAGRGLPSPHPSETTKPLALRMVVRDDSPHPGGRLSAYPPPSPGGCLASRCLVTISQEQLSPSPSGRRGLPVRWDPLERGTRWTERWQVPQSREKPPAGIVSKSSMGLGEMVDSWGCGDRLRRSSRAKAGKQERDRGAGWA